jgi:hypothetical protein
MDFLGSRDQARRSRDMVRILIIICLIQFSFMALPVNIQASFSLESVEGQVIQDLIEEYIHYFNVRSIDGLLSLYADDAKIKTEINGKKVFVTKNEYKKLLPARVKEWARKSMKLVECNIEGLEVGEDSADLRIEMRGKRGIFSGRVRGSLELVRVGPNWKIKLDDV